MLVFSTMHHDDKTDVNTGCTMKPGMITLYNVIKSETYVANELKMRFGYPIQSSLLLTVFFIFLALRTLVQ